MKTVIVKIEKMMVHASRTPNITNGRPSDGAVSLNSLLRCKHLIHPIEWNMWQ